MRLRIRAPGAGRGGRGDVVLEGTRRTAQRARYPVVDGGVTSDPARIAAVAQVGYENAFAFSAAFKRAHGHSPAGWRRAGRDGEN